MFFFVEKVTGENILRKHENKILFFYKNSFNSLDVFYFFLPKLRPFLIS